VKTNFILFGLTHWLILVSVPAAAALLAWLTRGSEQRAQAARIALGALLFGNELGWYAFKIHKGWIQFPAGLPLQLCDLTMWLTILAALRPIQWAFEFAFFTGLAGTSMALITPDLWEPFPSYPTVYFFLAHGGIVATLLFSWWSRQAAPKPGCVWRVMAVVNAYALAIGLFNALFKTNYMYLCRKPESASLLDYLGPWPLYIVSGELLALLFFTLLWLPFRRRPAAKVLS